MKKYNIKKAKGQGGIDVVDSKTKRVVKHCKNRKQAKKVVDQGD